MSAANAKLIFVTCLVINCIIWAQSRYAVQYHPELAQPHKVSLWKRDTFSHSTYSNISLLLNAEPTCEPLAFEIGPKQCAHVQTVCPTSDTFLSIPYLQIHFCSDATTRPFIFVGLLFWLLFLFSTLGISASDFFTPNLATIAQFLGLDENVAGVTFLAFGNASPDVFSTFSAMRADSGSLAIGELLGAASFIVSCVVGSMCIIKPFKVDRTPFLRDVGFFTVAVGMLLVILWDGEILPWESWLLVFMYVVYAVTVVLGSWWERRQERRRRVEALIRAEYGEEESVSVVPPPPFRDEEPYHDIPPTSSTSDSLTVPIPLASPVPARGRAVSSPVPPRLGLQTQLPPRPRSRIESPSPSPLQTPHLTQMPSFSLVGALEFRQVVAELQNQASSSSLNIFDSPITPYAGGRYHHRHRSSSHNSVHLHSPSHSQELDPWDTALGLQLNDRSPRMSRRLDESITEDRDREEEYAPSRGEDVEPSPMTIPTIPSISRTPASPLSSASSSTDVEGYIPIIPTRRQRIGRILSRTYHILFPSLHHFRDKTLIGKIVSLLAAPAVMALTLTLPVVVMPYESIDAREEKLHSSQHGHHHNHHGNGNGVETRLVDFEEEGVDVARALIAEEEVQEDLHEMKYNKWLMAAQCACGPVFGVGVLFSRSAHVESLLIGTAIAGVIAGILVIIFADERPHPTLRMARCSMGFMVAIVWIMAIADEVVNVLQTFGFIFGLSDAIIGLTIFAVGNSLADLVANMSVAVFAPIMGFSACFGGPMLNILLGVGMSGSYIINQTAVPYKLHFTPTLVASTLGLLGLLLVTLVVVPMNGYMLSRKWGAFLVGAYFVVMGVNLFVELSL
ncbi:Sodium/calcium exchanger protein-domain-containing protein [Hygrophoropsis aurantiaca]|uniref:Sodium/calcium exchanger protein-domain-containing protein n=1 Tax=Hygrophoropsis aurantiaca TaxID=72124 RepID=A0ACB8A4G9_9AGAM|nr:Sodium/calcium exchanger protein-domain-containing protein [Hygrophoropsis aurantiaca]